MAEGYDRVLAGFSSFNGSLGTVAIATAPAPVPTLAYTESLAPVPHLDGKPAGEIAGVDFWVHFRQLALAESHDLLYPHYDPTDHEKERHAQRIRDLGPNAPALLVLPRGETVTITGETLPMFTVYHDPVDYWGYDAAKVARVRVRIPANVTKPSDILFLALTEQQHRKEMTLLEKCDVAARLREDGYPLDVIARAYATDPETAKPPSESTISAFVSISGLPQSARAHVGRGKLHYSHARLIAAWLDKNPALAALAAEWCVQERATVGQLDTVLKRIAPKGLPPSARLIERDGRVLYDVDRPIRLVSDRRKAPPPPLVYPSVFGAKERAVRQVMAQAQVEVVAHPDPAQCGVLAESLYPLAEWISDREGVVTFTDIETELVGYLEALRVRAEEVVAGNGIVVDAAAQEA